MTFKVPGPSKSSEKSVCEPGTISKFAELPKQTPGGVAVTDVIGVGALTVITAVPLWF